MNPEEFLALAREYSQARERVCAWMASERAAGRSSEPKRYPGWDAYYEIAQRYDAALRSLA